MPMPLPQLLPDAQPGGPTAAAMNALNQYSTNRIQNQVAKSVAPYAPYEEYAKTRNALIDAQMAPLKYISPLLQNPQLAYLNPGIVNKLMDSVYNPSSMAPSMGDMAPLPGGMHPAVPMLNALLNQVGYRATPSNSSNSLNGMAPMQGPYSGQGSAALSNSLSNVSQDGSTQNPSGTLAPTSGDPGENGLIKNMAIRAQTSQAVPGSIVGLAGAPTSVPTNESTSKFQSSILGIDKALPIIKDLQEQSKDLLKNNISNKMSLSQIQGWLDTHGLSIGDLPLESLGADRELLSKKAEFEANQQQAVHNLIPSLGLHPNEETIRNLTQIVQPVDGESPSGYYGRMYREMNNLVKQENLVKNRSSGGINLNPSSVPPEDVSRRTSGSDSAPAKAAPSISPDILNNPNIALYKSSTGKYYPISRDLAKGHAGLKEVTKDEYMKNG